MLHTRNVAKAQNYNSRKFGLKNVIEDKEYNFFSTKQLHLLMLCIFQDSAKWVSAKRVLANREDTVFCYNFSFHLHVPFRHYISSMCFLQNVLNHAMAFGK